MILSVGAPVFRQYAYEPGPLFGDDTQVAVVTGVPAEAHVSPAALAVVGSPAEVCKALVRRVEPRRGASPESMPRPAPPAPPPMGAPLRASHVLAALAERLPRNAILLEECPSNRSELHARIPAREPLGFISAAMGGLGFAMPAAIGIRMAIESRPTLAVVGDGSSLYAIQCLWSAVHYRVGVLFIVLDNDGYAIMDQLASRYGGSGPWPDFAEADISTIARGFGCEARDIEAHDGLVEALDTALPELAARESPLLLRVRVARD
jgi:benzoylformate decarboxylase